VLSCVLEYAVNTDRSTNQSAAYGVLSSGDRRIGLRINLLPTETE